MTDPREIIAATLRDIELYTWPASNRYADAVLTALSSAGYHLLSDAELAARDNAVLERAAVVAERLSDDWVGENGGAACLAIKAAILNIKEP